MAPVLIGVLAAAHRRAGRLVRVPLLAAAAAAGLLAAGAPAAGLAAGLTVDAAALPGLYDVSGVAADDVLNIRAEPAASSAIIGRLAHDATGIEAVAAQDGWLQVNSGERSGWVNGRYMTAREGVWPAAGLPEGLSCLGTEPFWRMTPDAGRVRLSSLGNDDQSWPIEAVLASGAPRDLQRAVVAGEVVAVVTPAMCSDGMSDRAYGLAAVLVLGRGNQAQMLNGCCQISSPR